jgi:hypothetical protein
MYLNETTNRINQGSNFLFLLIVTLILGMGANSSALAAPADTIEIVAKHPESGSRSTYQISFNISKKIPSKALIRVTFPGGFDLSNLMIAGSSTINGGFDLKVDGQVVTLKRSGLGREIPASEKVDVKFAIVKNPQQPADNYKVVIEIIDDDQASIVKHEKLHKILPSKE